jgi:hypothetical protein
MTGDVWQRAQRSRRVWSVVRRIAHRIAATSRLAGLVGRAFFTFSIPSMMNDDEQAERVGAVSVSFPSLWPLAELRKLSKPFF